ncbi:MAG: hypothetical protein K2X29_02600 [Candidatus Obscuribacterales bacterium]|nr:hypothetical protein [Candidatus Obscuribacterales bacterium]
MKNSTFVRWVMAFVFTLMSCAPSFACCKDASPETPAAVQTNSANSTCLNKAFGDCECSQTQCGADCDKCKNVVEITEKITMSVQEGSECTVGVDREICRIIYVPPSGPIRQCFKTHEDVKGTPRADGKCCQVVVDGRQYCVQKGGSIYIPGLMPGDKGITAKSLTVVTVPAKNSTLTVDGKPQTYFEKIIFAVPGGCCSAAADRQPGDECTVQVTRQQCTWVGGSPGQPPQRICWTTREDVKGKWSGNCCTVTVDSKQYCVQEGGGIFVPGVIEGERSVTGSKSLLNKFLSAPLNVLKSIVGAVQRPFKK